MKILLVDDDPSYRQAMELYLRTEGRSVVSAGDGAEALDKLKDSQIDFIISDVYMPVMDGIKFHKAVQEVPDFAKIPFLFVSGFDDDHTMEAVRASSGSTGFMKKARPVEELEEWIVYLSSPPDKRPSFRPGMGMKPHLPDRSTRDTGRFGR